MFKFIMCALIIISATLLGNNFSQRLINRRKCLSEIIESINRMNALIAFNGYDIHKVIMDGFSNTFLCENLSTETEPDDIYMWWSDAVRSIDKSKGILREDKELLLSLGKGLGVTDIEGQTSHLMLYNELFKQRYSDSKESEKEKSRLYRVLGFSLGCAVLLIIV